MSPELQALARKAALGTLTDAERATLDAHLAAHPEDRAEVEWDRAFAEQLDDKIRAMPAMPGWARTVARMHPAQASGVIDRIGEWLRSTLGLGLNLQALAAALIIAQAGVIGVMLYQDRTQYAEMRGSATPLAGPMLRVAFRDDVREAEMRAALAAIGGEIVGGPGQLGLYIVRVRTSDLAAAAERLRASGATRLVEIFEAKP